MKHKFEIRYNPVWSCSNSLYRVGVYLTSTDNEALWRELAEQNDFCLVNLGFQPNPEECVRVAMEWIQANKESLSVCDYVLRKYENFSYSEEFGPTIVAHWCKEGESKKDEYYLPDSLIGSATLDVIKLLIEKANESEAR